MRTNEMETAGKLGVDAFNWIEILGTNYRACDVIWLHQTGEWPQGLIIHVNGDTKDDRWANLKLIPEAQIVTQIGNA
jgi:hypothetical protein